MQVLLVDDEPLARMRLRALLQDCGDPATDVIGEAADAAAAQALLRDKACDLLLLDIGLPGTDGMQLAGDRFTSEAALFGNDLATQPNYPAEIRAPQGTLPGVSSFQIQIADYDILTAGDRPDVLVAMNPAALKANIDDLPRAAEPMLNMIEWWICLSMPPDEVEKIARFRELSPAQKALMLSARKEAGKFTEGVILSKSMEVLFRAVPPSLYLALAQTEPEEKAERYQLMQQHGVSELDAAFKVAEKIDRARGIESPALALP